MQLQLCEKPYTDTIPILYAVNNITFFCMFICSPTVPLLFVFLFTLYKMYATAELWKTTETKLIWTHWNLEIWKWKRWCKSFILLFPDNVTVYYAYNKYVPIDIFSTLDLNRPKKIVFKVYSFFLVVFFYLTVEKKEQSKVTNVQKCPPSFMF